MFLAFVSGYPLEAESCRKGFVRYAVSKIPIPLVSLLVGMVPAFGVTFPAFLLKDRPLLYAVFCGLGFPVLAFVVRKVSAAIRAFPVCSTH